jgi:DNA repair exonuclease SbcCD ATPase subunit
MGQGHSEEFVSAREDLGHATGHLLPAIAVMVTKVLGLKLKPTEEQKRIGRLERQLQRARGKAKGGKKARAEVARLEAALEQARSELEAAQAESAAIRTSCCSCPSCAPGAQPVTWATPGTRLRGSTLAEWLGGWQELEDRRASSARHEARRDHLAALPDAVVEQAAEDELDALEEVLRDIKPPRGQRAGHATTRLHDAIDRRRQQLSRPAPAPDRADRLIDAATAVLRSSPPPGVDLAYLEAFVERHRDRLQGLVTSALSHRTAGAA